MKTTNINYSDAEGKGSLTLYKNRFDNGNEYYARFDRETVTVDNMIARMQKKDIGINAIVAKHILSLYKAEVLEAASKAESVNLFDLGTLYPAAIGVKGTTNETTTIEKIVVRFTSSKELNTAVKDIEIKKVTLASSTPITGKITDMFSQKEDGTATIGKVLRIEGSRLKFTGNDSGIFFAPIDESLAYDTDEKTWIKSPAVMRNAPKMLEVFIPETLEEGRKYAVLHKSGAAQKDGSWLYTIAILCNVTAAAAAA